VGRGTCNESLTPFHGVFILRAKAIIFLSLAFFLFLGGFSALAGELDDIRAAIAEKGAQWTARETSVSRLPAELRRKRGMQQEPFSPYEAGEFMHPTPTPDGLPQSLDWRNYYGGNFVTPIRDQGNCGSCWAFGSTASLESYTLIKNNTPGQNLDLSEQVMISCGGIGGCGGGFHGDASNFFRDVGLPRESCYPYTATNGDCSNACSNWQENTYKIARWSFLDDYYLDLIKTALSLYGPLVTTMRVHTDFYYYGSGVYSYTWGGFESYHVVQIIGYDDPGQYLIAKNSWGTDWGEAGFFKIAYSNVHAYPVWFGDGSITYWCDIPLIRFSPAYLSPVCALGQNAASQIFAVWNGGAGTLNYTLSANAPWLSCTPVSGASTGEQDTITVNYAAAGLAAGTYNAAITISVPGAANNPQTIPVQLRVGAMRKVPMAGGEYHSLALKADGGVVAWGLNNNGQCDVPAAARSGVAAVAAGLRHSLALKGDGGVAAWGLNDYGQCDVPAAARSGVIAVATKTSHCLALKADGRVVAWGKNTSGQCNVPTEAQSGVMAVAAGGGYSLALKTNGCVVAWGSNAASVCEVPAAAQSAVVAVAAGRVHVLALKTDGCVVAWGNDTSGQSNVPAEARSGVMAVAAGNDHSLALKTDGRVVAWGDGSNGLRPVPLAAQSGVVAVAAGVYHDLAQWAGGRLVAWGHNLYGQCNAPPLGRDLAPASLLLSD
jgi:hypothetical protein